MNDDLDLCYRARVMVECYRTVFGIWLLLLANKMLPARCRPVLEVEELTRDIATMMIAAGPLRK